ncbi:PTS glucose/sucrose transporter subunit IIB [Nocardiopsis sp. CNR-923]|uniref:PTS glucose/sucrose transporter subunit IIB n=1 Tax=Nocardiopsis sp. CNR-923 TaxID=1904965 RepID=UPI0029168EA7|nr:PTS glucose/sucrose transporter subunit IIB [Nocardiopsis sp. CNR-923]
MSGRSEARRRHPPLSRRPFLVSGSSRLADPRRRPNIDGEPQEPAGTHSRERTRQGGLMADKAAAIVAGLGGAGNIEDIEACITRLRTEVYDPGLVDEKALRAAGAHGVLVSGAVVQVVVGPEADTLTDDIHDLLD